VSETEDAPTLASWAADRSLCFRESSFALPQATQLLRHGFIRDVFQDGALCCFVPGTLTEASEIDGLCLASSRVLGEVTRIGYGTLVESGATPVIDPSSRRGRIEAELSEHPFSSPPESVKKAARAFKHGLLVGDKAWKLGAEAFFREQMSSAGFQRIEESLYRATHIQTFLPGQINHVAEGKAGTVFENTFLVLTNNTEYESMGWTTLVADGRSLIFSTLDGGPRDRNGKELAAFLDGCQSVLQSAV